MSTFVTDARELIGNTPVIKLPELAVYVKLEKYNAAGSIKDRAVLGMLEDAFEKGTITKDSILVEATSGNTGIALAMLGAALGIRVVIVMPENMSNERRELIKAYGAQLVLSPKETGMKGAVALADEILNKYPEARMLAQFKNPANPNKHYETTATEILEQVPNVDIFVAGVGTGGTFTGVGRKLKELKKDVLAVAVEPAGSPVISQGQAGPHKIQGIGANFVPDNFDRELMDEIVTITDEEAFATVQEFMRQTGIAIGISSGAAVAAAKKIAAKHPGKNVVTVAPDGVDKYLSMLTFDDVTYIEV